MNRNYALDFFKLFATFFICFHHLVGYFNFQIEQSGYLFVELFFILSGFFLYKNFSTIKEEDEFSYTKKRIKKLYPHYIFSFFTLFLFLAISNIFTPVIPGNKLLFVPLSEIFMLHSIGIFKGNFNSPTWYLSVMIVGGYFIYYLLRNNSNKFIRFTGPLIILGSYTLINSTLGGKIESWDNILIFCLPLLRGTADMIIGCILGVIIDNKNSLLKIKLSPYYIKLIELITYFLIYMLLTQKTNYELCVLLLFPILILISFSPHSFSNKLFNKKIFQKIGKISYPMYLNHLLIIKILQLFFDKTVNTFLLTLGYFIILIIYSLLTMNSVKIIEKYSKKNIY